ncbi:poly-gamma-glutamate hydrolase family protein [Halobium salinum]|uniref:Poly-gamma-glutamate hydrolase family protein n=1 Tax=Halobium salinum TaxID=1364940 RepID=A0ABD5PHD7_9EURY|nr:poly-gamma-glutamate hydrolase family protein [Halobium salinum]
MTDDNTTTDIDADDATDTESRLRRRTLMGLGLASPAFGGLGLAALQSRLAGASDGTAADPFRLSGSTTATDATARQARTRVTDPVDGQTEVAEDYGVVSASTSLLRSLGADVGRQLRIRRTDDEYAVYTVVEAHEGSEPLVRMNGTAKSRLALAEGDWVGEPDCRLGCPRPEETPAIADETFDAEAESVVPAADLTAEEAREADELVEDATEGGTEFLVLAPHGGDVEPRTAEQAEHVRDRVDDATTWLTKGFRAGGGAFVRWHVPSFAIHPASYPALADVAGRRYERAVSFHGICSDCIQVGGAAPKSVRARVRDAINAALPESASPAILADGAYRAEGEHVLVNQLTAGDEGGVWVGQPVADRERYWRAIADAVVDAVRGEN